MSVWKTNGGIYFGHQIEEPHAEPPGMSRLDDEWVPRTGQFNEYEGDRQIVTIGPNGSGKTRKLLVPNLHRLTGWSILCVDPKGELAVWTAKHRHDAGNQIITFDPFGVIERRYPGLVEQQPYLKSIGLNPIAALNPSHEDFPDDAKALGEALIKIDNKSETYWAKSAQALITGLIMAVSANRADDPDSASLVKIRDLLGRPPEILGKAITALIALTRDKEPAIATKLGRFTEIRPDNKELFSILSTAITQTDWIDSRPIKAELSRGKAMSFGRMKERPATIYLVLPPRYLETHATWLRLMITAVLLPLIRTTGGKVPVLFMLDEFAQLGHLEVIEQNMALLRGYGVKLWAILQDLAQLQDNYERRWESFIGNAGILQAFGPQDLTTLDYLSKKSGQRLYWLENTSVSRSQQIGGAGHTESTSTQTSYNHIQGPVYWDRSLAAMNGPRAVLFPAGFPPRRTWLPDPAEDAPNRPGLPAVRAMLQAADATAAQYEKI